MPCVQLVRHLLQKIQGSKTQFFFWILPKKQQSKSGTRQEDQTLPAQPTPESSYINLGFYIYKLEI